MLGKAVVLAAVVAVCAGDMWCRVLEKSDDRFKIKLSFSVYYNIPEWKMKLKLEAGTQILSVESPELATWTPKEGKTNAGYLNNLASNGNLGKGTVLTGDIEVRCYMSCNFPLEIIVEEPTRGGQFDWDGTMLDLGDPIGAGQGTKDYADALRQSILFYYAQRSGELPDNNPIPWRDDSFLDDCVLGGWFDGADHAKFGLPLGFATHVLMWGLYQFKDGYEAAGQLDMMYDMIKWATDYMLAAYDMSTKELVAQVGDGGDQWASPENVTEDRSCIKMSESNPAPELYGEWAAALAAGYLVWTDKGDTDYANEMLNEAKSMYAIGKGSSKSKYNKIPGIKEYYQSYGYKDELCLGAIWLYRATGEPQYLEDAKGYYESGIAWEFSWDDKQVACQLLLYEETEDSSYASDVEGFIKDFSSGSVVHTTCGLAFRQQTRPNRYAGGAAWIALEAAEAGIDADASRKFAVEQINFFLGDNNAKPGKCFSHESGYGSNYEAQPYHRGARNCGDCTLYGALVGGPFIHNNESFFTAERVSIDQNAGFQSALAGIVHLQVDDAVPGTQTACPCQDE